VRALGGIEEAPVNFPCWQVPQSEDMDPPTQFSRSTQMNNEQRKGQEGDPSGNVDDSETSDDSQLPARQPRRSRGRRRTQAQRNYRCSNRAEQGGGLDPIHLRDFGDVLGPKPKDRLRFGGGNMDQFHTVHNNNEKVNLLRTWA